eukprot:3683616-Pleurochrysis_carterae.AAC.1
MYFPTQLQDTQRRKRPETSHGNAQHTHISGCAHPMTVIEVAIWPRSLPAKQRSATLACTAIPGE